MRLRQKIAPARLLPVFWVGLFSALVFAGTVGSGFVWDDRGYILNNPVIRSLNWQNLRAAFSQSFEGNYAPLHILSYMLIHAFSGEAPWGYHLANVALHIFNSAFLFLLLFRITKHRGPSLFAALLFAVHPVQAENVAWASELKTLLATALILPAFYLYVRYAESGKNGFCWGSNLLYAASLLGKVSTIAFPLLLIAYDFCFREKLNKRNLADKVPCFVIAGILSLISILSQTSNRGLLYFRGSPWATFLTTLVAVKEYLRHLALPVNLSPYYSFIHTRLSDPEVLVSLVLIAAIAWGTLRLYRRDRRIAFWAFWFWIVMLPNLNIVPLSVLMADRYLYLPLIGPAMLAGFLFFGTVKQPAVPIRLRRNRLGWAIGGVMVLCFSAISHARSGIWQSDLTLWSDTVTRTRHEIPYNNLGAAYLKLGRVREAENAFQKAIRIQPAYDAPYLNLGLIYKQRGENQKAESYFSRALKWNSKETAASASLAALLVRDDKLGEALQVIEPGLGFAPRDHRLLNLKAHILARQGDLVGALSLYKGLLDRFPQSYMNWYNYGAVLARLHRFDEAERALKRARDMEPGALQAWVELGRLYEARNAYGRAAETYETAVSRNIKGPRLLNNLAYLYAEHFPGKIDRAIDLAREALESSPDDPDILDTLGWACYQDGNLPQAETYLKRALELRPDEPYTIYHLGLVLIKGGDDARGKAYLRQLTRIYPRHPLSGRVGQILQP